jgi:hypothetical protein
MSFVCYADGNGRACKFKRPTKDRPDRPGIAPVLPLQARCFKLACCSQCNPGRREQGVAIAPWLLSSQKSHPFCHNLVDSRSHGKAVGRKRPAVCRLYLTRVLVAAICYRSMCLNFIEAMGLSRAPVNSAKADRVRFRCSVSVWEGIVSMTCLTCSSVGAFRTRLLVALRPQT